jgi:predicted HTH domain antitoxin
MKRKLPVTETKNRRNETKKAKIRERKEQDHAYEILCLEEKNLNCAKLLRNLKSVLHQ